MSPDPLDQGWQGTCTACAFAQVLTSLLRLKYEVPISVQRTADVVETVCQPWSGISLKELCSTWNEKLPMLKDINGKFLYKVQVVTKKANFQETLDCAGRFAGTPCAIAIYKSADQPVEHHAVAVFDAIGAPLPKLVCTNSQLSKGMHMYLEATDIVELHCIQITVLDVMQQGNHIRIPASSLLFSQKASAPVWQAVAHKREVRAHRLEVELVEAKQQIDSLCELSRQERDLHAEQMKMLLSEWKVEVTRLRRHARAMGAQRNTKTTHSPWNSNPMQSEGLPDADLSAVAEYKRKGMQDNENDIAVHTQAGPRNVGAILSGSTGMQAASVLMFAFASSGWVEIIKQMCCTSSHCKAVLNDEGECLRRAAAQGHVDMIQYLGKARAEIEALQHQSVTALHLAALQGHCSVVQALLKLRATLDVRVGIDLEALNSQTDGMGYTLWHPAADEYDFNTIQALFEAHAHIDGESYSKGVTALHVAAGSGHLSVVQALCNSRADMEAITSSGHTPLLVASGWGRLEIARYLLLEAHADFQATAAMGVGVLHAAILNNHLNIVKLLCDDEAQKNINEDINSSSIDFTVRASKTANRKIIKDFMHQSTNKFGDSALHEACYCGHIAIVKYLCDDVGVNIEGVNQDGSTPLFCASQDGHLEIAEYLIRHASANPETRTFNGDSLMHNAAMHGHRELLNFLLEDLKADVEATNLSGFTPLLEACFHGHLEIFEYLVTEANADVHVANHRGGSALHLAVFAGRRETVKYLCSDLGADVEIRKKDGITPLLYACFAGHLDVLSYLLYEAGADIQAACLEGGTCLHYAAARGHLEVVQHLCCHAGVDVLVKDINGHSPRFRTVFALRKAREVLIPGDTEQAANVDRLKQVRDYLKAWEVRTPTGLPLNELFVESD